MYFDDYQVEAAATAVYPGQGKFVGLAYASLGLNGEAGEVAEQVKKTWRDQPEEEVNGSVFDKDIVITEERRQACIDELGDVLWYAAQVATELGVNLSDVAKRNQEKLYSRKERGVIAGDGSNR